MDDTLALNAMFPALYASRAIAINQVGYEANGGKIAVLCLGAGTAFVSARVIDAGGEVAFACEIGEPESVEGWKGQVWQRIDFSALEFAGSFRIEAADANGDLVMSEAFEIAETIYTDRFSPAILGYFQSQRTNETYTDADRTVPFVGSKRNGTADVHGGWYDASGDVSKYLSHLSYANSMNPQQTPLVVWALSKAAVCPHIDRALHPAFRAEALYGADFLMRMCDPEGMFYMTVFDRWSGDVAQREICSYATQKGLKYDSWEAGYRQGGGMAIAALARAARLAHGGEFSPAQYLATAQRAFAHLEEHNLDYLDDGEENIIDDYCALLAATELTRSANEVVYREAARKRANSLLDRITEGGWWRADEAGALPFFHASDEGLPLAALVDYLALADEGEKVRIGATLTCATRHLLEVTGDTANPFGYPRQVVQQSPGALGTQFFYPHVNPSGYWWQGENARLGSIAYALKRVSPYIEDALVPLAQVQSQRCVDWILGSNPFHSCMLQGFGQNWSIYGPAKFANADGGICNGITSSLTDESDIAFCETEDPMQSWRWSEQWLPHAAWFLLALTEY